MIVKIDVPDYSPSKGLRMEWEDGHSISATQDEGSTVLTANRAGLISLARLILTLANDHVPSGHHWHLDSSNALEEGSIELIIVKD